MGRCVVVSVALVWSAMVAVAALAGPEVAMAMAAENLPLPTSSDWPWWRGPHADNHAAPDQSPPLTWDSNANVLWRVALPGKGHATPCIRGGRIYLPAGDARQQAVWVLCLDAATGQKLWQTEVYHGPSPKIHADNSLASAMPACDGQRVYFPYQTPDSVCLAALNLDGKVVWNKPVGPYKSIQGYSASPVLYQSLVIVPVDGGLGNTLFALNRQSGEVAWKSPLPEGRESYASALVGRVAGRDQLVMVGGKQTTSYDPSSGKRLWECDGPAEFCVAVVAFGPDVVYATGGYPQKALLAIRADGSGNVTKTHVLWQSDKKAGYVPSPLLINNSLYAVSDNGLMRCYDAGDGKVIWENDFKAPFYSSPVAVGDRIYVFDRKGKGYVMKAGRQFELLATNELPDGAFATPVFIGGRIYLRTLSGLFCLGTKP